MYMIDKDAVLNMIDINIEPHTHGAWDSGYNVALSEMREKIKQMPTVEAEPVKHGRWEHGECSVCGASPLDHVSGDMYVEVDYYPNYCPSCGSQNVDLWVDDESVPNEDMRPDNEVI